MQDGIPDYVDEWARRIWERHGERIQATRGESTRDQLIRDLVAPLEPTEREITMLTMQLRGKVRERAVPFDPPRRRATGEI